MIEAGPPSPLLDWAKVVLPSLLAPIAAYGAARWGADQGYKRTRQERGFDQRLRWYEATAIMLSEHTARVTTAAETERVLGLTDRTVAAMDAARDALPSIGEQLALGKLYASRQGALVAAVLTDETARAALLLPSAPIPDRYVKLYRHAHRVHGMLDDLVNEVRGLVGADSFDRYTVAEIEAYAERIRAAAEKAPLPKHPAYAAGDHLP